MYEIRVDLRNRLIYDKLTGYWDTTTAERFFEELRSAFGQMAAAGPGWKILANHEEFATQSPEVTAILLKVHDCAMAKGLAKAAVYMPSALTRIQVKRLVATRSVGDSASEGGVPVRVFASEKEARAWLEE